MVAFDKHAFKALDAELVQLHEMALRMADLINRQLQLLDSALYGPSAEFQDAKHYDRQINDLEFEIEQHVSGMVSKYPLIGEELRFVMSMLKISSALERMGDMAKNCVKRAAKIATPIPPQLKSSVVRMRESVLEMISISLSLLTDYEEDKEARLLSMESDVELQYKDVLQQLMTSTDNNDGNSLRESTHLLFILKNLERMSDHALDIMKICYYVHFGRKFSRSGE